MADNGVITLVERASDPTSPPSGKQNLYVKTDGLHLQNASGSIITGVSGSRTFYASSSSGGAVTVLNTVTIVNGFITGWTQV